MSKKEKKTDSIPKIIEGKIKKFYSEICLEEQAYIRDPKIKVGDLLKQHISVFGENITIVRFERYQVS